MKRKPTPQPTRRQLLNRLERLQFEEVAEIYSGRPGCACGCRGNYRDGEKAWVVLLNMKKFAPESLEHHVGLDIEGRPYISVENKNRVYTVYLKKGRKR